MSKRLPWWKKHVSDWRAGTRRMSLELKGFYGECLDAQWDLQTELPIDDKKLSIMLDCSPRSVRKLMPLLVAAGKMVKTPTGYYNPRMMKDIVGGEFEVNSTGIRTEFEPKIDKNPMFSTREERRQIPEERNKKAPACEDGQIFLEGGRVKIGEPMAAELLAKYPHASIEQVEVLAAPELTKLASHRRPTQAELVAIVWKVALWNDKDNSRTTARGTVANPGQPRALDVIRGIA